MAAPDVLSDQTDSPPRRQAHDPPALTSGLVISLSAPQYASFSQRFPISILHATTEVSVALSRSFILLVIRDNL